MSLKFSKYMKICSACLLGINCRFDGASKENKKVVELSKKEMLLPVCPEQLGGLTTPREPAECQNGRIVTASGRDVSTEFERGAREVLKIARLYNATEAILRKKSPSCGCGLIPDGTFSDSLVEGDGVTAALLKKNGIKVISEDEL
jgi:uncharacterized protein YbbK (DUF523 family)